MAKLARDIMTPDPVCCSKQTTLDEVARLMVQHNCGEIPIVDSTGKPVGVITDRDIVCRVIAAGKNPCAYSVESCMSRSIVTVRDGAPLDDVIAMMEDHQIRRIPVVDEDGYCAGIIAQADLAAVGPPRQTAEFLWELSRDGESMRPITFNA